MLTPHPGEMARLAGITIAKVQANRLETARSFAERMGVTLVLKGARTLIAHPDGRVAINTSGNPGMAKGGSGDVLTGLIAGLLAQYPHDPAQAVEAAVYLHGLAADLAVREGDEHTLLATDCLGNWRGVSVARNIILMLAAKTGMFGCKGHCVRRTKAHAADERSRANASDEVQAMTEAATLAEGKMYEFTTQSGADTIAVGRKLAGLLKPPQLLLLRGDLGTGKTTLVKGIAQALDAAEPEEVTSPTFTLIHEYDGSREGKP